MCCIINAANAANYYFSSSSGDDARSVEQAQHPETPWKTLDKLNSFFSSIQAGDSILFKRGDIFDGPIRVIRDGKASSPIVFDAYGTGNKPVINGFYTIKHWKPLDKGVWEAIYDAPVLRINMLTIDGKVQALGRYPNPDAANKGWLTVKSHVGKTQLTDNSLPGSPDFTGAQVVLRTANFLIDIDSVANHKDSVLTLVPYQLSGTPKNKFGYFFQNHPAALDQFGEWCTDPANKKVLVFFGSKDPSGYQVRISVIDTLVHIRARSYIVFNDLRFEGSNMLGMITNNSRIVVKHCDFLYNGINGLVAYNTFSLQADSCYFDHTQNNAIYLAPHCFNTVLQNCIIKNTGTMPGMGKPGNSSYQAITIYGNNNLVQFNEIDTTGYVGIRFDGDSVTIRNNYINYHDFVKDDGGGIYTQTANPLLANANRRVVNNIVVNGPGANEGTPAPAYVPASGIYMDDNTDHVEIDSNTVANNAIAGIYLHNAQDIAIRNNILFNNLSQIRMQHDPQAVNSRISNIVIQDNLLFAKTPGQLMYDYYVADDTISQYGAIKNNFYYRGDATNDFARSQDIRNMAKTRKMIPPDEEIIHINDNVVLDYNPSVKPKPVSAEHEDIVNTGKNRHPGAIRISPYGSVILKQKK
jgi:parallel beta-helix repeat protein